MSQYFAAMFRRRPNDGWFRIGRYDATTIDILSALAIASMVLFGINISWWSELIFFPSAVRDFEIWRVFTWPIATPPDIFALVGVAFFWSFGQQVEGMMGRNRFAIWTLAVTAVPAIVVTVTGGIFPGLNFVYDPRTVVLGLSTLFLCAIWLYAATYPNVRFFDVVPLWAVAAVFTVLNVLNFSGQRAGGMVLFYVVAIATALSVGRSLGFATAWPIPHIGGPSGASKRRSSKPPRPTKPKRRKPNPGTSSSGVVQGPWRNDEIPRPPAAAPSRAEPSLEDQAELDGLLDKISETGMSSLTDDEKRRLNDLSKRLRNR